MKRLKNLLVNDPSNKLTNGLLQHPTRGRRNQKNHPTRKMIAFMKRMIIVVIQKLTVLLKKIKGAGSHLGDVVGAALLLLQRKVALHPLREDEEDQRRHDNAFGLYFYCFH